MKVTVVKKQEDKNLNLISSIIMLVLGIILTLNANQLITTIFIILGVIVTAFGIIRLGTYFKDKKQFNLDNNETLVSGILGIAIGLLTILLASILSNAIQIISGIWLLLVGLNVIDGPELSITNFPFATGSLLFSAQSVICIPFTCR